MAELTWAITRKWNRFQVHSGDHILAAEPGNLLNRNSFRYSGLARPKAIHIASVADNKGLTVSFKKSHFSKAQTWKKSGTRSYLKSMRKAANSFSPALTKAALARVSRLSRAQKVAAGLIKNKKTKAAPKPAEAQKQ